MYLHELTAKNFWKSLIKPKHILFYIWLHIVFLRIWSTISFIWGAHLQSTEYIAKKIVALYEGFTEIEAWDLINYLILHADPTLATTHARPPAWLSRRPPFAYPERGHTKDQEKTTRSWVLIKSQGQAASHLPWQDDREAECLKDGF